MSTTTTALFADVDMTTYYGHCPYDKLQQQKVWLKWMSRPDISGIPFAECARKMLDDSPHHGTVRERVLDDL